MKKSTLIVFNIVVFALSLIVYLLTMSHSLSFTDSGELAAVASSLGIAHPTGYPLYTIIGHIWTLLPLPMMNIVKLNLLSAILIASANVLLYNILLVIARELNHQNSIQNKSKSIDEVNIFTRITAMLMAIAFGLSAVVWEQAVINEVYSLHFLLANVSIFLLLKAFFEKNDKFFFAAALFLGLGFSNHLTTLLLIPTALYLFFKNREKGFDFSGQRFKVLLMILVPFFIGLSVYLYLPIRSSMEPMFNWGYVSRSFDKLLYHISGKQYQVWMFSGTEAWSGNFSKFFGAIFDNIGSLIILPFVFGIYYIINSKDKISSILNMIFAPILLPISELKKKGKTLIVISLIMIISCIAYSFNYSIHDIDSYFYLGYLGIFLFLSIAAFGAVRQNKNFAYLMILVPIIMLFMNFESIDKSEDYSVEEYTKLMVDNLPENSIIISAQWDFFCSAFWYLQQIEGYRRDVVMIEKELMRRTWYPYQFEKWHPDVASKSKFETQAFMKDLELFESGGAYNPMSIQTNFVNLFNSYIDKNIDSVDVFLTLDVLQSEPEVGKAYFKIPYGFAFKLSKQYDTLSIDKYKMNTEKLYKSLKSGDNHLYQGLRQAVAISLFNIARYGLTTGQKDNAKEYYLRAKQFDPNNSDFNILSSEF